jgi:hypothetical protein
MTTCGDNLGMVGISANDYLGSVEILWEWLELQAMTTCGDNLGMVGITANDYLGSVEILWEWLELQPMTTWDQWRYSGNDWNYSQ